MITPILLDLGILLILVVFALRGRKHGFVRALCSFLALFIAFFGAIYVSRFLTPPLADLLAPRVLPSIVKRIDSSSFVQNTEQELTDQGVGAVIDQLGLPDSWGKMISQWKDTRGGGFDLFKPLETLLAQSILEIIISAVLFILSFLILLIVWRLISRSLDLVSRLPVLNFCNRLLGLLLGLCKAVLLLFLLRWLLVDICGILSPELLSQTFTVRLLSSLPATLPHIRFFLLDAPQGLIPRISF